MANDRVAFTPLAERDLEAIWRYTKDQWSSRQADKYVDDILQTADLLARGERQGRMVAVREGYLKYPVGSHFIFFRRSDAGIVVVRVLHQRMDVESRL